MFETIARRTFLTTLATLIASGCGSTPEIEGETQPFGDSSYTRKIAVRDGETQPIYALAEAIRETIYVEAPMDSDSDGVLDRVALDVIRPRDADPSVRFSTIMEPSPYWGLFAREPARGFRGWYDEHFVPRGYAVMEVEMQGTSRSTGCPSTGGKDDTLSIVSVVDWLNGRAKAYYADGTEAVASWSNGLVGMVGVSYNGTLPIASASTGVQGLKTIVPIGAISSWYDYTRDHGIGYSRWDDRYPEWLASYVISAQARERCGDVLTKLGDEADDATFDYNAFWAERDYRREASQIQASVFVVHGQEDWNVKPHQYGRLWSELVRLNVPRKIWLHAEGHIDPVMADAEVWKKTFHRWMDHWLYDVENGIMDEPMARLQRPDRTWTTDALWPPIETVDTSFHLGPIGTEGAGTLAQTAVEGDETQTLTDSPSAAESEMISTPEQQKPSRLAFFTPPLENPLRIAGNATVALRVTAASSSAPVSALLVDYGESSAPPARSYAFEELALIDCSLADLEQRVGCAAPQRDAPVTTTARVVTRGSIDLKNRASLLEATPVEAGQIYEVRFALHPKDYVFPRGHRIGLVLVANNTSYASVDPAASQLTVAFSGSELVLPVTPAP